MKILTPILNRRSIRKYKADAVVTKEQIEALLTAAMLAPSACNSRAWEFVVVRNRETLTQIANAHPYAKMLQTASLAIIVCAVPGLQKGISEGYFPQDCAAATQNILLEAADMGLGSCWCGVYPKEERVKELRDLLQLGEHLLPFNIIAIGEPAESPDQRGKYEESKVHWIDYTEGN